MTPTWTSDTPPDPVQITALGWLRVLVRGTLIAAVVFGGFAVLLLLRLIERPIFREYRPITPFITVWACRMTLRIMGLRYAVHGQQMTEPGALVANHSTWLDIFVLNAGGPLYFVAKSGVANWPGIGWLARGTGTVFVDRDRSQAHAQTWLFRSRLENGHTLLFFPEGTSTDGMRVLPFKSTLFQSFFDPSLHERTCLQAVSVKYTAPVGQPPRFFGWWGDMGFAPNLVQVLAMAPQGGVDVVYHPPIAVSEYTDRKSLAAALEARVRASHKAAD